MICDLQYVQPLPDGRHLLKCPECRREIRTRHPDRPFRAVCGAGMTASDGPRLTDKEQAELFPGETDPTLLGNRIAALTAAIGIPPCGACKKRQHWLNQAHHWLRAQFGGL